MLDERVSWQRIEQLIQLLKKGDTSSLARLRHSLSKAQRDLAFELGVSENTLERWENGTQQPPKVHLATWRIKLSCYIDENISTLLGIIDNETRAKFWALMWELVE